MSQKGTRALSVVPLPCALSSSSEPPAATTRSCMVVMPRRLARACAAAGSKPLPSSRIVRSISPASASRRSQTRLALACLATLVSASCAMRNSATAASRRSRRLRSRARSSNSTAMLVRLANSSPYQPSAAPRPYSSRSGGALRELRVAALGDVEAGADQLDDAPLFVAHDLALRAHDALGAVRAAHTVLVREAAALGECAGNHGRGEHAIGGMHPLEEGFEARLHCHGVNAIDAVELLRPGHPPVARLPFPGAQARHLLGFGEQRALLAQRLLGALAP